MTYPQDPRELSDTQVLDLIDTYLSGKTERTQEAYREDLRDLEKWRKESGDGIPNLLCLSLDDLRAYKQILGDRGLSASTIVRRIFRAPALYQVANRYGVTGVDLRVSEIESPVRAASSETRYIDVRTLREIVRAANYLPPSREAAVRLVGLYGLQPQDIGRLSVVDFHESHDPPALSVGVKDQRRLLLLDSRTSDLLVQSRADRRRGPLLLTQFSTPIGGRNLTLTIRRAAKLAGVSESINSQQLRATMIRYALARGVADREVAKSVGITWLQKLEDYLPSDREILPRAGLVVAEELAPDPTEKLRAFIEDHGRGATFPPAGLCALIGLLAEYHLRGAMNRLGGKVKGSESLVSLVAAVRAVAKESGTLARDVNRLAEIRNRAAHGHLNDVSVADVEEAMALLVSIERDCASAR